MENVFVRPIVGADGNAVPVPDPQTGNYLQAAGEWKPRTVYWLRRIMFGDVVVCAPPAAPAPAAAPIAPAAAPIAVGETRVFSADGQVLDSLAAPAPAPAISTASVAANPETPLA